MYTSGFQSFAFQTVGYGGTPPAPTVMGGHFLPIYENRKRRKRELGNIGIVYDTARALDDEEVSELLEAIEPYIEDGEEKKPEQSLNKIPDFHKINYEALEANNAAYQKFMSAINNIQQSMENYNIAQKEEDELLQIAIICCTIN